MPHRDLAPQGFAKDFSGLAEKYAQIRDDIDAAIYKACSKETWMCLSETNDGIYFQIEDESHVEYTFLELLEEGWDDHTYLDGTGNDEGFAADILKLETAFAAAIENRKAKYKEYVRIIPGGMADQDRAKRSR